MLAAIETHRYPAKYAAIVQVSFKLGLRALEIALLRLREVCQIGREHPSGYALKDTLVLPKRFTKGARATANRGGRDPVRTSVRFPVTEFDKLARWIARTARAGHTIDYYPPTKVSGGRTRELPLSDPGLIRALDRYLAERAQVPATFRPNASLFLSQKRGPYSPDTSHWTHLLGYDLVRLLACEAARAHGCEPREVFRTIASFGASLH